MHCKISFIQLIRNLTADAFLIKFRSSNWLPEVYQATANISDTTMKNLVVQYIGIVGQESRSMKHLLSQTSVSVESLIASAFDLRSKAPSTKREKRFAQEIQEIPLPGIIDMRNWALLPFKHLLKLYAANDSLSSDGMKCVDKTRQYFLSLDVIKCKRQELLLCIECLELSSSISDDARRIMANDDRFIDQLVIVHSQSSESYGIFLSPLYL